MLTIDCWWDLLYSMECLCKTKSCMSTQTTGNALDFLPAEERVDGGGKKGGGAEKMDLISWVVFFQHWASSEQFC